MSHDLKYICCGSEGDTAPTSIGTLLASWQETDSRAATVMLSQGAAFNGACTRIECETEGCIDGIPIFLIWFGQAPLGRPHSGEPRRQINEIESFEANVFCPVFSSGSEAE